MHDKTQSRINLLGGYCLVTFLGATGMAPYATAEEIPQLKCRTPVRNMAEKLQSESIFNTASRQAAKTFPPPNQPVTIPVWFHVIYKVVSGQPKGNVSDAVIAKQITVLNNAYQGSGFQFSLAGTDRTESADWFDQCLDNEALEPVYKKQLAVDPTHILNAYTCNSISGLLGFATFPDMYAESSAMHGVVLSYRSLPGGPAPYGEGDTATHEIGHYLGLYHTFDDDRTSCTVDNDLVGDTAIERTPNFDCPVKRDTCANKLGKDPVTNYMDYSADACMTGFSIGQVKRMQAQVLAFKPSLVP